ncbi:Bacterial PH-like domain [Phytophthora cinnamomi]|uniref:Bacterial PH-like domain n=1 Tax=Phytophthora cinnamomi TaxID=4785 RepID=UPI00355AB85C|nr:Bacterial PH-like domain [Phytophthora cinnamomi]
MGNTNSAIKGLASDIAGTTDICDVVADLAGAWAASYVLPEEEILYALQSARQEFAFTSRALVTVSAETSTTTRKLVERYEYRSHRVEGVKFESTGVVDRDCELQFQVGQAKFKIDIVRGKEEQVKAFYKTLVLLGHRQEENELEWELARQAVAAAKDTVRLSEAGTQSLNQQSDETLGWMKAQYERTHPLCYKDVIKGALAAAQAERKEE